MKKIVIVCAGDFGRELAWLIEDINAKCPTYEILGFLDDDDDKIGKKFNGYKCIGKTDTLTELSKEQEVYATIATQDGGLRKRIVEANQDFHNWETLLHPSANVSETSKLGAGCVVCANCIISVNSVFGDHCIFNIGVTVGHDCEMGDY
ncbi:MAG: hypothetical protein Q4E17_06460, partial [Synergistes sp.]|nr:hypothetical protein [Synergistes sp.]